MTKIGSPQGSTLPDTRGQWLTQGKAFVQLFELQAELAIFFHGIPFFLERIIQRQTVYSDLGI